MLNQFMASKDPGPDKRKLEEFFITTGFYVIYGENMECLLEGLDAIFRHIGVVPEELWFDKPYL